MSQADRIIEKWIDTASSRGEKFFRHKVIFWRARDFMEGVLKLEDHPRYDAMINFIVEMKTKTPKDKQIILHALRR